MASNPGKRRERVRRHWAGRAGGRMIGSVSGHGRIGIDENRGNMWEIVRQLLTAGIEIRVNISLDRAQHPARCKCGWEEWYKSPYEAQRALKLHRQSCAG